MIMRRAALLALCFATLFASAGGTSAVGSAGVPYKKGDAFIYDTGRVEIYAGRTNKGLTWKSLSGRQYVRDDSFFVPILDVNRKNKRVSSEVRGDVDKPWELKPGARARFSVVSDVERREKGAKWDTAESRRSAEFWECRVGQARTVAVPAGSYASYPVRCDRYSASSMRVLKREIWYYAPKLGHYVRRETVSFGSGKSSERNLVAALPAHQASKKRIRAIVRAHKK